MLHTYTHTLSGIPSSLLRSPLSRSRSDIKRKWKLLWEAVGTFWFSRLEFGQHCATFILGNQQVGLNYLQLIFQKKKKKKRKKAAAAEHAVLFHTEWNLWAMKAWMRAHKTNKYSLFRTFDCKLWSKSFVTWYTVWFGLKWEREQHRAEGAGWG